ncbi:MAG: alanine racemase, partial [Thermoleophilaceae bacterium]
RPRFADLCSRLAAERGRPARVHVKHDSGMGRLGERDPDAVVELARRCAGDEHLELAGIWTHLATADEDDPAFMRRQLAAFAAVAARVREIEPGVLAHAANSAATIREPDSHLDLVRCGVAIYGLDPFQRDPAAQGLEPALRLSSYVADVKRFEAGDSAGYGRSWTAPEATWVGVLPVGYGDGVRRALSNNAEVLVRGRRVPLVGTVSMDNVTIDLGPDTDVEPGDEAVLIGAQDGEQILAEEWAARLATINYEVTTGIGPRVPRVPA